MLVEKIEKTKKGSYKVTIDGMEYLFSEDVVVQYRMTIGHETSKEEIKKAMDAEDIQGFYNKAVSYSLRYGKGEAKVREYLKDKGASYQVINTIIDRMKGGKILNDNALIDSYILSLSKKGNGKLLIKEKLYQKGFSKEDIEDRINLMDLEEYKDGLIKLFKKVEHKYDKYESYIRREKLKAYLIGRGYSYSEIAFLL